MCRHTWLYALKLYLMLIRPISQTDRDKYLDEDAVMAPSGGEDCERCRYYEVVFDNKLHVYYGRDDEALRQFPYTQSP
ncbi:hypothetical protein VIBNISOn1_p0217 [Vibrio nigripulchritudo SOn1]|uniref:Uncharacterized protein n=1 Tax=Vibrio nigripulchritudo SOn1 TaxID=1238450 RepID=A0AAV2W0M7_9VIBR|nr:hypothetical protein VIBNISOn1_p0217 [Vibrio nigripulchritudo SOn1]